MLKLDEMMECFTAEGGKFFPLGQALPIQDSPDTARNGCQNSSQGMRKEAYVY